MDWFFIKTGEEHLHAVLYLSFKAPDYISLAGKGLFISGSWAHDQHSLGWVKLMVLFK